MTKRLIILVGCLCLALLTNLSFRVPTTVQAQAQAVCVTATAPAFTLGVDKNLQLPGGGVLKDGDLFYLGNNNGVQFSTTAPNSFLQTFSNEASQVPIGYPNTINLRFQNQTPNTTATALSCLDSIWDINFVLYGGGGNAAGVAGDVFEIFLQQPDGSGRINLVTFTNTLDGTGTTVTGLIAGGDLSAVGHTPTSIGRVIPFEIPGGEFNGIPQLRTNLITLALPMDGSIPNCAQLGINIRKAGGNGRSMIVIANLVVTRSAATTAIGTGISSGIAQLRYPTARVCDLICPPCPNPIACTPDLTICFADARTWCNRLAIGGTYRRNYLVTIPDFNGGVGVPVFDGPTVNPFVRLFLRCGSVTPLLSVRERLEAEYIAAQLTLQHQVPFWFIQVNKQKLACHVIRMLMAGQTRAIPVTLSNGVVLDGNSTLLDLFNATEWALLKGTAADQQRVLEIYKQLNNCTAD